MTTDCTEPVESAAASHGALHPITPDQRIVAVDILRGLAILGILTVNIYLYGHPYQLDYTGYLDFIGADPRDHVVDRVVSDVVNFLFQDTLYCLFAFVFAFGMATLMARARDSGTPFGRLYGRRMFVLLGIGVCHVVFLWAGDILVSYALLGFLLLLFRQRSYGALLTWSGACLSATAIGLAGLLLLVTLREPAGLGAPNGAAVASRAARDEAHIPATSTAVTSTTHAAPAPGTTNLPPQIRKWIQWTCDTYSGGSYRQIILPRIVDYVTWTAQLVLMQYPRILGMFLLGLYAGRRGILWDIPSHLGLIRKVCLWGVVFGVAGSVVTIAATLNNEHGLLSGLGLVAMVGDSVRLPALCLALAAGVILLLQRDLWKRRLGPLAAVGRMSLSNYLLQSVVCTTIFYGYGLGLFGKVGPAAGLLLATGIFLVQIPVSTWWLRRFRFGPVEWLWRTLTYGERQPMRS